MSFFASHLDVEKPFFRGARDAAGAGVGDQAPCVSEKFLASRLGVSETSRILACFFLVEVCFLVLLVFSRRLQKTRVFATVPRVAKKRESSGAA